MAQSSPEKIWKLNQTDLLELLNTQKPQIKPRKIHFYTPSFMHYKTSQQCSTPNSFPTISITAKKCSLQCKHCQSKLLETMHPANTPQKLFELCTQLKQQGAIGCLISGGCLPNGSLPLQKFLATIERIKRELDLIVFVHTGIIDQTTASKLKEANVDAALIDVIGSNQTIKEIYNLNATTKKYETSLKALTNSGLPFVPHIIAGLHHGKLEGEFKALKMVSNGKPSALVILSFIPIKETPMANTNPPTPSDIAKVIAAARNMFPDTPIALGCMRPKGKHRAETDILALKAGADAIAFPTQEAINFSRNHQYEISFSSFCCAQIYRDLIQTKQQNCFRRN